MDLAPVVCSNCGTPNEAGRKFCAQCGTSLAKPCAVCGTLNTASDRFCGECGSALDGAPAAHATLASVESSAERRLVSVMFVDLVGFTTLAEGRDAEETRELLTRYFDVARGVIERHGGTVEKFIGDAVMAVWGAPTAHEDDAERAVRAALELVAAVPSLGDDAHPLQARAGVLTGEAAVTIGATNQGMVAGDMVNTASRLQSAAAPGTVLVGEATVHAASNAISFEPAGEQALKGKVAPVPAWRAITVVARRGGSGRAATLEPPFVGRDDELRLLKELFDATAREQKSRLVTVIGQAGIGKSRLAWEFEKYLDGVVDTAYWHEGRSPSYGEGISYWALAEMVRRRAGIAEGDDEATIRRRLGATLDEFILDPAERRWIEPPLAGLLGLAELPTEGREELFAAWRTFFERMAAVAPVVMVFSDLQWADQGLLDFVEDLLHWTRNAPIFVVGSARPELMERRAGFGERLRSVARISLEPLSDDAMRQLLEGLVPGLPPAALRSMVQRAEGIPLYAVETVRMLLDRELLVATDGGYEVGDLSGLGVADTLQALIASRLDANRPEDRALLLDASVLGQSFTVEALAAVAGAQPAELSDRLNRLAQRELLAVEADPRSPERGQYMFVQALVREVAYQNLAKGDRRQRHLAAARYFEGLGSEELSGVLASHYLAAYQASRPGEEADALAAQARIALIAAAERASALHSHRQALAHLEQAMIVTKDPAEQALLHLRAAELGDLSSRDAGLRHAEQARDLFNSVGDARGALRAATWVGRHLTSGKREAQAIETFEAAIAEAEPIRDSAEYAEALAELSRVYMMTQRSEEAVATADRALLLAGKHRQTRAVVEALINKGTALLVLGRTVEAESVLRGAIAVADRNNLTNSALRARNNLMASVIDSVPEAEELMQESYEMAVRLGHVALRQQFAFGLAELANHAGHADRWSSEMAAIEEAEELGPVFAERFASVRSLLAALRGDLEEATAQEARASQAAASLQSGVVSASQDLLRGQLAFFRGDWPTAAELALASTENSNFVLEGAIWATFAAVAGDLRDELRAALAVGRGSPYQGGRMTDAVIAAGEAGLAAREGRWEEVHAGYRSAVDAIHESGYFIYEAMTGLEWGMLAGSRDPEALTAGEAGAAFFADRGASVVVERYRAAFVPVSESPSAAPGVPDPVGREVPSV
jgi:class 3 adenylate cyclase/predicted ATPase